MQELYFLGVLVLNVITAVVFFNLGKTGQMPQLPRIVKRQKQESNFTDPDLEDIRNVDPKSIQEAFIKSLKKDKGKPADQDVAKDFENLMN